MHHYSRFDDAALAPHPIFAGHSTGYTAASLIDRSTGSVHTGLSINQLAPGGRIDPHVHSFEEGFYILSGEAVVTIAGTSYHLAPGDYAAVTVGTPHAWHAAGSVPVRWLQMAAPQPKPAGAERDTFFARDRSVPSEAPRLDLSNLNGNLLGHFDAGMIPPVGERKTVAAGLEGVFLKWMIDEEFGARHHRLLFIEYQPGVGIGLHDHTFEEAYFILEGEVQAVLDGTTYDLTPGDVVWTGVGCVHSFRNVGNRPVRWLETFAPQPPKENVFRFMAEWETRARDIE
jgi:mannose-6-phosphate isomerase-like protein (cupin superfamily)